MVLSVPDHLDMENFVTSDHSCVFVLPFEILMHITYNPVCSVNSPSLTSMSHMMSTGGQRSSLVAAGTPSVSSSVAHSSFTSTGTHHQTLSQDVNIPNDILEPIRPDICLQHVWTDHTNSWYVEAIT